MEIKTDVTLNHVTAIDLKRVFLSVYSLSEGKGFFADPSGVGPMPSKEMQVREDQLDEAIRTFLLDLEYEKAHPYPGDE